MAIPECDLEGPLGNYLATRDEIVVAGPEEDVAARFVKAIEAYPCDAFIRICGDSPMVHPALIDFLIMFNTVTRPTFVHVDLGIRGTIVELVRTQDFLEGVPMFGKDLREHVTLAYKMDSFLVDTMQDLDVLRSRVADANA